MEDRSKRRRRKTLYETLLKASRQDLSWKGRRALAGVYMRKARLLPVLLEEMIAKMRRLVATKNTTRIKKLLHGPNIHSVKRLLEIHLQLCIEDAEHAEENTCFIQPIKQVIRETQELSAEMWMLMALQQLKSGCAECKTKARKRLAVLRNTLPHRAQLIDRALSAIGFNQSYQE